MAEQRFDTFLSHSSADKPAVEALARLLKKDGIDSWLDKWHLIPGNPWQEEIEQAAFDYFNGDSDAAEVRIIITAFLASKDDIKAAIEMATGNELVRHQAGEGLPSEANLLFRRETDRAIRSVTLAQQLPPLSRTDCSRDIKCS